MMNEYMTITTTVDKYGVRYNVVDSNGLIVAGANEFKEAVRYAMLYVKDEDGEDE